MRIEVTVCRQLRRCAVSGSPSCVGNVLGCTVFALTSANVQSDPESAPSGPQENMAPQGPEKASHAWKEAGGSAVS